MDKQNNLIIIDNYLHDKMEEKERLAFEQDMAKDEELALEIEQHREANEVLATYRNMELQQKLAQRSRRMLWAEERTPRRIQPMVWAAAATVLLLVGSFFTWQWASGDNVNSQPVALEDILAKATPPTVSKQLSGSSEKDEATLLWKDFIHTFENKNCAATVEQADNNLKNSVFEQIYGDQTRLYGGFCAYQINDLSQAVNWLTIIPETSGFYQDAQWYLGFTYLKQERSEQAILAFQTVSAIQMDKEKREKAEELVEQIRRMEK